MDANSSYSATSATSSSLTSRFPSLTSRQRALLDAIVKRTPTGNYSTAPLLEAYKEVMHENQIDNDAEIYGIMLKLAYFSGDWTQRWRAAMDQQEDGMRTPPARQQVQPRTAVSSVRAHLDHLDATKSTPRLSAPTSRTSGWRGRLEEATPMDSPLQSTPHARQRYYTLPASRVKFAPQPAEESALIEESDEDEENGRDAYTIAADRFRTLRLFGAHWDVWRSRINAQERRERQTVHARDLVLLRHGFIVWAVRLRHRAALSARAAQLRRTSLLQGALQVWQGKAARQQRLRWESMMRQKLDATRLTIETRLIDQTWERWVLRALQARADRFNAGSLAVTAMDRWKHAYVAANDLRRRADQHSRKTILLRSFESWNRKAGISLIEQHVHCRISGHLLNASWSLWRQSAEEGVMADQLYDRRLLGATLATWRRRLEGLAELEQRVEAVKYGTDVSLVAQALRHWLLRHRVNCLASRRRSRLFQQWREKLSFREAEREGARLLVALWERADHLSEQASDFLKYRSARSLHSALLKWKERLDQQRHLESTAAAGSSSVLLANKFTHWSVATRRHQHVSSKAAELSDLSLQKRLLYRWQDRCRGKQLEKACDALLTKKRIEDTAVMFMDWRQRANRRRQIITQLAGQQARTRQDLLAHTLTLWITRTVNIRESLLEVDQYRQDSLATRFFARWRSLAAEKRREAQACHQLAERWAQRRLTASIKIWTDALRQSQRRKRRLARFADRQKRLLAGSAWDRWRCLLERRRLRRLYADFVQQRVNSILRTALSTWQRKTTILPSVASDAARLKRSSLAVWRDKLPLRIDENAAFKFDRAHTAGKLFKLWKGKRRDRYARRQASRFRQQPLTTEARPLGARCKILPTYDPAASSTSDDETDAALRPPPKIARPSRPSVTSARSPRVESEVVAAIRASLARPRSGV